MGRYEKREKEGERNRGATKERGGGDKVLHMDFSAPGERQRDKNKDRDLCGSSLNSNLRSIE